MHVQTTDTWDREDERPAPDRAAAHTGRHGAYLPGLTGLRALAVVGVAATAVGLPWLPGGEVAGVEILFVVSGYLLVAGLRVTARPATVVDVVRRCAARARRILPALLIVLGAAALFVLVERPGDLYLLGADIRASLLGVYNWHLIAATASPAGEPSLLQHLWPLAVGAQLTALILVGAVAVRSPRARAVAAGIAVAVAVTATVALAVLAANGGMGPRLWYGTDVRAGGMLLGAALALGVRPASTGGVAGVRGRRVRAVGLVALIGLVVVMLVGGSTAWLGRGGLLLTDVLAALAVAAAVRGAPLRVLDGAAAQWVGLRAYALYLWHWPVLVALGVSAGGTRPPVAATYALATLLLADLTYRFVEVPLRATWWVRGTGGGGRPGLAAGVAALASGAACAAALMTAPP